MALFGQDNGIHFKQPSQLMPYVADVANLNVFDNGNTIRASSTTAFFTQMAAAFGLQDTSDWTADTPKTLLDVSSGAGFVGAIIGPTAGGASTTTFEITNDGVLDEIAITVASGQRAALVCTLGGAADYTSAEVFLYPGVGETISAGKNTFAASSNPVRVIRPWRHSAMVPMLRFSQSLLIRAKHSASITNSTATAYSAVMYRLDP